MSSQFPISVFLNTGFELSATLTTVAGGSSGISIQFWNEFEAMRVAEFEFDSTAPIARCKTSDVASAVQNDTLEVDSKTYYISDIQNDGLGITLLILTDEAL